jgi:hypothetical protein
VASVNQCDLHCPVKTMMGIKYRLEQQSPDPVAKALSIANWGLRGAKQTGRSWASCPHRAMPEGQWHASQKCIDEAQAMADESGATRAQLTEHERRALADIRFREDPPALDK